MLRLCHAADQVMRSVFDQYTTEDANEGLSRFDKTIIPVRLARFGTESVVSRSQAQRVLARVERFKTVILDFTGIDSIGQGFADEIFRVFQGQHPEVALLVQNANEDVTFMVKRAKANANA